MHFNVRQLKALGVSRFINYCIFITRYLKERKKNAETVKQIVFHDGGSIRNFIWYTHLCIWYILEFHFQLTYLLTFIRIRCLSQFLRQLAHYKSRFYNNKFIALLIFLYYVFAHILTKNYTKELCFQIFISLYD